MRAVDNTTGAPAAWERADSKDYRAFSEFLEEASGIRLGDDKGYLVRSRLGNLMRDHDCDTLGELVSRMQGERGKELRTRVVDAMTTNETLWFRDTYPFEVLKETVFPEFGHLVRPLRVWSSACSSGQEPYSISMAVDEFKRERPGRLRWGADILATDISPSALEAARVACFDEYALRRGLSDERRSRYFRDTPDGCRLRDEVCAPVRFRQVNLLGSFATLGRFDVVFCRNVLIYFSQTRKADILSRIGETLTPGGYLFLGATESMPTGTPGMSLVRQRRGLVYRKD